MHLSSDTNLPQIVRLDGGDVKQESESLLQWLHDRFGDTQHKWSSHFHQIKSQCWFLSADRGIRWRRCQSGQHVRDTEPSGVADHEYCLAHLFAELVHARSAGDVHCEDYITNCDTGGAGYVDSREDSSGNRSTQSRQGDTHDLVAACGLDQSHRDLLRKLQHREEFGFGESERPVNGR